MNYIKKDIMDIRKGVIAHQVNCQDAIGAGISGVIIKKYPEVEKNYHWIFKQMSKKELFGRWQPVPVTGSLIIVNMFTQFYYGNPKKTGKIYTDADKLVTALTQICSYYPDKEIYVSERIGCGFGGADWGELEKRLMALRVTIVSQTQDISNTYRACR